MPIGSIIPPNMKEIRVPNAVSAYDLWTLDKGMLRGYPETIEIDWASNKPTPSDFATLTSAKERKWLNPENPFEVNPESIGEITQNLIPELEETWQAHFREMPTIEAVSPANYLPRMQELDRMSMVQAGYGMVGNFIPGAVCYPIGVIVVPRKYMIRGTDGNISEHTWDKPYLEQIMSEELSHALFRQLRYEWKEDYSKVMGILGPEVGRRISLLNEVLAQNAKDRLSLNHPNWSLYVVAEKMLFIYTRKPGQWEDMKAMHDYMGILALSGRFKLSEIAMIDNMIVPGKIPKVYISLNEDHYYHSRKWKAFRESMQKS